MLTATEDRPGRWAVIVLLLAGADRAGRILAERLERWPCLVVRHTTADEGDALKRRGGRS